MTVGTAHFAHGAVVTEMWLVSRDLFENIYSREVLKEYQRRREEARGKPWSSGAIPEIFLGKVLGSSQTESALLPP